MHKCIFEIANDQAIAEVRRAYAGTVLEKEELKVQVERYRQTEALLKSLLWPSADPSKTVAKIPLKEAVYAPDFKILFPKVITDGLRMPVEPKYVGQQLLSKTIQVEGNRIYEFPVLGTIRAHEIPEHGEPPMEDPAFSKNTTEVRVRRFGLQLGVGNDVIEESQWELLGYYLNAANDALLRLKEEQVFTAYEQYSYTRFDNSSTDATFQTTGKASDGDTANGTFDLMNLLDMMATLIQNNYIPSDVVLHPMMWALWAKDPFLRYQLLMQGQVGQQAMVPSLDGAGSYAPFGLNVVVTPFQKVELGKTLATGITGTGNYASITVLDRGRAMLILQKTPVSMVKFEDVMRDIQRIMLHERYGLGVLDGGRSSIVAKNIALATNYEPLYTIRQVAAS